MGVRHEGRELALKALYQMEIRGESSNEALALFFENFPADDASRLFALRLVDGVRREQAALDAYLAQTLEHWSVRRLSRIDHSILRLALYELMHLDEVPARVTLDEAIELAKVYGDAESGRFVNGVLDRLAKRLNLMGKGEESNPKAI